MGHRTNRLAWGYLSLLLILIPAAAEITTPPKLAKEIYVLNWQNYLKPSIRQDFEREFGVRVIEDHFMSNEDLLAKLQAGGSGYDLIVPSDYTVRLLIRREMLAPLHRDRIPNLKNLDPQFRHPSYDPELRYSVPYLWGVTGIGYSRAALSPAPESWAALFKPAERCAGRISMMNDMREAIGAALIYLGFSPNSMDPVQLKAAEEVLIRQKPSVAKYDSEAYEDSLTAKELVLAHGWSGEFLAAQREDLNIGFVVPKEGSLLFVDNLVIPKTSERQATAEAFIDYLLRAEVAAANSTHLGYPTANAAARSLIDPSASGARYTVPQGVPLHSVEDLGEAGKLYERIWTEIKAH